MANKANWFDLTGTRSVVVGSSQGIGAGIAIGLAEAGSSVVLAGRNADRLLETRRQAELSGVVLGLEEVDVACPPSIDDFAGRVVTRYGPPTILVNSANVRSFANAVDMTVDDWDETQNVQLRGPFLTSRAFAPAMIAEGYGKVINLSSQWAVRISEQRSAYSAAKAGLSHLTAALAVEWAPFGVRVNALAPAATRTASVDALFAREPELETKLRALMPLGRIATVDDIVPAAIYLASRGSDFVSGQTLHIDGASSARI